VYFVTFRLADSLPGTELERLRREALEVKQIAGSDLEKLRVLKLGIRRKLERYLDRGAGECLLRKADAAAVVAKALLHFDGVRYHLFAWCVMPNHVHAVIQPTGNWEIAQILHSWKSYSSRKIGETAGKSGAIWQREYYDHLIREGGDFDRVVRYVCGNPTKAGLNNWKYVGQGHLGGSLEVEFGDRG
jgi:putative transposase